MANYYNILTICLVVLALIQLAVADISTLERIKKHQEWLNTRNNNKHKTDKEKYTKWKSSLELANLWRVNKQLPSTKQNLRINEAYAENETTSVKSNLIGDVSTDLKPIISTQAPGFRSLNDVQPVANNVAASSESPYITTTSTTATTTTTTTTAEPSMTTKSLIPEEPEILPTESAEDVTSTTATSTTTKKPKVKLRLYPRWANWSAWSECSRSCGGGVNYQTRKCIDRNSSTGRVFTSDTCVGLNKRYQICNDLPCPADSLEIRAYQCAAYNKVDFQGRKYNWEPYIKDDAECELNCKPMGMKYFATLNETVIDGTPCQRPAEYYRSKSTYAGRAMCVDGICKAVLGNGSIKGLYANSGSVACGGLLCRPITGIFTRDPLPEDAYVHVATIPAGASNISITELKNSANLLVLRTSEQKSIFNNENEMSESGTYEGAGTTFDYHRIDGIQQGEGVTEWITSTGPIKDSIELLVYNNLVNPGVKYEYLLPIVSDSEENELSLESSDGFLRSGREGDDGSSSSSMRTGRRRKYNWRVVGLSACTKSCGGGTQAPIVRCARENTVRYYSQRRCNHMKKPVVDEKILHCNTHPCPPYWRTDEWGECRCQYGEPFRRRELSCVQELALGIVIHVDKAACKEEQPPNSKQCECPKGRRRTSARYRMHLHSDTTNTTHLSRQRPSKSVTDAVWLMSEWNQYCSSSCGPGIQYRTIFCDRSKSKTTERCDPRDIPENRRPCDQTACEVGDWYTGPWSPCSGDCFNLTRSRPVLCIKNLLITDDDECKLNLKPQSVENCSHEEIEYCAPRWHYSEWSECSKSCDGGTQRRSIKCLEYDDKQNALRDSDKCRYALRLSTFRNCNTEKCEDLNNELLQKDDAMACVDNFPNCKWAVQARLCSTDYYRTNCCASCTKLH